MKVLVYSTKFKEEHIPYIQSLFSALDRYGFTPIVEQNYLAQLQENDIVSDLKSISSYEDLKSDNVDFLVSLGGDGTILSAVTLIQDLDIPILGINLGRLGFLSNIEKTKIEDAIAIISEKKYKIEKRTLIHFDSKSEAFGSFPYALNEFTLAKRDTSSMITVHTYIDGEFLNSYWADGIIISTPTGSTGYNLSCGGPIVFPHSNNFAITPIAPHNLNVRPIVIPDDKEITLEIESRSDNYLCTLDSRYESISSDHKITIKKGKFEIGFIALEDIDFMKTMRNKLMWGLDKRNF